MDDMNALLRDLHAERRERQGLPVPPVEAPAPVEPPAPVVEAPRDQLSHTHTCTTGLQGGCTLCRFIWALLSEHARKCTKPAGSCPVPCCAQYKAELAQMQQQGAEGETTTAS